MERQPVRVTIFHQTFSLLAEGNPADLERAAETVDALMQLLAAQSPTTDTTRIAMLACLHLADRLHSINSIVEDV